MYNYKKKRGVYINIAICDNNPIINNIISDMLDEYTENRKIQIKYETFTDYNQVINKIDKFDLFILDYNMSDNDESVSENKTDGMTFARYLRSFRNSHKGIIFITSYPDFVYEAFEVRTFRFLIKPIEKDKLFEALDVYIHQNIKSYKILININKVNHIININDIYYIEVFRKSATLHFNDDTLKCHKTISSFEEELLPFGFCRIQRSYLVNTAKIKKFNSKTAILDNGKELSISTKYCADLCERYLQAKENNL